ncbi:MAG: N-acetylmuramoyl-L-alanine amidase [Lachnospiraceae bacterium]|nr:N-acetylmuramoyl-L-alanine amidase [Lachnospiraceae bacterium]
MENREPQYKRKKPGHALFWIIFIEIVVVSLAVLYLIFTQMVQHQDSGLADEEMTISYHDVEKDPVPETYVPKPEIDEQILTINKWSRPGTKIQSLDYIVIHYLGNPKTTAQENHDYFESLKDLQNVSMSANYVIGIEGEIIHCVPDDEVAYASNDMNDYSISIENCHKTKTGKFTKATYASLVHLTAYLSELYDIDRDHIIRHYDVTGKACPLYYVNHEDKWEEFRDDVMEMRETHKEEAIRAEQEKHAALQDNNLEAFLESNALD